jgi:putative membrane protein
MSTLRADGATPIFHLLRPASRTLGPFGIVSDITFHPVPLIVLAAATVLYLRAVRRVEATGGVWPRWRTWSFLAAIAALVVATLSGLDAFERSSFAVVGTQDSLIAFVAPFFLSISAPVTLAIAAAGPTRGERIRAAFTGRTARVLSYPLVAATIFGGWLFVLYFTPIFGAGLDHAALWQLINLSLLVAGCLFAWPMAAVDPLPRVTGHGWRMLWLLLTLPYTTILGMSLESQGKGIARGVTPAELHTGGGIIWTVGGFLGLFAAIVVLVQWCRLEETSADRRDRVLDPEAAAQLAYWKANRRMAAEQAGLIPRRAEDQQESEALARRGAETLALHAGQTPLALPAGAARIPAGEPPPDSTE